MTGVIEFILSHYKGKDDVFNRNNYRDIKLLDQIRKGTERAIAQLIRNRIKLDEL